MIWMLVADRKWKKEVQCNLFIALCFGSIEMDHVISEPCYKRTILQWNYRKMTILWSFSYNFLLNKVRGEKIWEPQRDHVISKSVLFWLFVRLI